MFQAIFLSLLHNSPVNFFNNNTLIDFQWLITLFSDAAINWSTRFFYICIMCSPIITRTHEETKTWWSTREILFSIHMLQVFANTLLTQIEKFWNHFGMLLLTYLAPELQRLHEIIKNFTYNEKYNPKKTYWITLQIVITNWLIKLKI